MANARIPKNTKKTLTSGKVTSLAADCEELNIRGAVALHQEIRLRKISTHGHSSFHALVKADILRNTGSCTIKGFCEITELSNAGQLKLYKGEITKVNSSGKLIVEQHLQAKQFEGIGVVKAKEILSVQFYLKLSGRSDIEQLIADEICIEKDKLSVSLFNNKKMISKNIKGKNIRLSYTNAESVEGDVVVIGDYCNIHTLYYTESYTISPTAKVQQIRRKEN
jgi:hypothetical protein